MLLVYDKILWLSLITSAQVFSQSKITIMSEIIENLGRRCDTFQVKNIFLKDSINH